MSFDGGVDAAAAALLDVSLTGLDDDAVLDAVREVESARRRLAAVDHRLIAELEVRSVAARRLQRDTSVLLSGVLHLDRAETRARVAAAAELGPRTSLNGQALSPLLPATAAAQAAGLVSATHVRVIRDAITRLPAAVDPPGRERVETDLAAEATRLRPRELAGVANRAVEELDPDGRLTEPVDQARRRGFTLGPQDNDGMSPVRGVLTPACRAVLDAALSELAKPEPTTDDDGAPDSAHPARDPRTPAQRNHDALAALAGLALHADTTGPPRGTPTTVVLTMSLTDLERRAGHATTASGGTLTVPDALRLAADAHWALAVVDDVGRPLWLSRTRRLATRAQRQALLARDGGCTRPGCDAPAAWCEAHHLVAWQDGGSTDLDNLALVCPYDHHLITDGGFTVALGDEGRVIWTSPPWLDPGGTPEVNHRFRPPDRPGARPPLPEPPGAAQRAVPTAEAGSVLDAAPGGRADRPRSAAARRARLPARGSPATVGS